MVDGWFFLKAIPIPVYTTVAVPLLSSSIEFTNQCKQKIKFSQDFYLMCQINIIFYWVLTMEPSTLIDLELVIMLLQQVVEKNKSMLLNKRSVLFQLVIWTGWEKSISFLVWHLHTWVSKKLLVTDPYVKQKLWWEKLVVCL